jgi:ribonuclease HI
LIPRQFADGYFEYHVFCDASQSAYGACVYLRCVSRDGAVTVNLVVGKGRVAPMKQQTVPRLELQAAVLAVELAAKVKDDLGLQMTPCRYWSDSRIVLAYIANETRRFKTFVANRIAFIRSHSQP